jgi:Tol biopolymer transport system component
MESVGDIFLVDPDGGIETRLTNDEFFNMQPAWSPDGNLIAFSSDRDSGGSMDIWLMYKDGTNLVQLYDSPADCYNPAFSPDGRKVAFSNGSSIYSIDINGDLASLKELAATGLLTGGLNWSSYLDLPTLEVQVNPSTVTPSQPATISWQSEGATEVSIEGIHVIQPPDGNLTVFPQSTTTYTLTAVGVKGAQESSITVTVE